MQDWAAPENFLYCLQPKEPETAAEALAGPAFGRRLNYTGRESPVLVLWHPGPVTASICADSCPTLFVMPVDAPRIFSFIDHLMMIKSAGGLTQLHSLARTIAIPMEADSDCTDVSAASSILAASFPAPSSLTLAASLASEVCTLELNDSRPLLSVILRRAGSSIR
jgi:hypothetical protein